MTKKITRIASIEPLKSLAEFSSGFTKLPPDHEDDHDLLNYFSPKIKMMERFALGFYQWCIVDFATQQLVHLGGMIEQMTGKPPAYWAGTTPEGMLPNWQSRKTSLIGRPMCSSSTNSFYRTRTSLPGEAFIRMSM